jgi:hypothetical protein
MMIMSRRRGTKQVPLTLASAATAHGVRGRIRSPRVVVRGEAAAAHRRRGRARGGRVAAVDVHVPAQRLRIGEPVPADAARVVRLAVAASRRGVAPSPCCCCRRLLACRPPAGPPATAAALHC